MRAARDAVHDLGPAASMDEIAAHARTSKSVFYRYFGDRAGLQRAVAQRATAHLERRLLEAADAGDGGPESLRRMVAACLTVAAASPHVYAFAVDREDTASGSGGPVLTPFFERVALLLEDGLTRALAGAGPTLHSPAVLHLWPRAAVGMVRSAVEAWLAAPEDERPDVDTTAAALADWLLHGVAPGHRSDDPGARRAGTAQR